MIPSLVRQEFAGHFEIALFIRGLHARPVHPLPSPLDRFCQVNRVFDYAGIDQAFAVRAEAEALGQAFLRAAGQ